MIVLDTNVLSSIISAPKSPAVFSWLNAQPSEEIWITAITIFEIRMGIEKLPDSRRRRQLELEFADALSVDLTGRVLAFDSSAAQQAGILYANCQRVGRPMDIRDAQIAGIVLINSATLATRNLRHFADADISLVDPWTA